MAVTKRLFINNLHAKLLLSQRRRKIVKIAIITSDTGINRLARGITGRRDYHRTIAVPVMIKLDALRIAASTIADKGTYSLFRTVRFLQYIRPILMRMRCGRRSCRCIR